VATDDWRRRYAIEADSTEAVVVCAQCGPVLSAGHRVALAELVAHARWHESHEHPSSVTGPPRDGA
jgi:hypothetical protein